MKKQLMQSSLILGILGLVLALALIPAPAQASPAIQSDDPVEQGAYLVRIAGCIGCHTPLTPEGELDLDHAFEGGRPFDLGELGVVFSKNLTSDEETGLGAWTDDEIRTAFQTGVSRDGLHLFPLMPYVIYNGMADSDAEAIVAYLRTLEPVKNEVPRNQILPPEVLPQLTLQTGVEAPDPADKEARGFYLVNSVMACTDCHTPLDAATGAPNMEMFLGGGQALEGPWGIVYGGNITPDEETGLGSWTDDEIKRVILTGVRPDGRIAIVMPWKHEYQAINGEDLDALVFYLKNGVEPVLNEVPQADLAEEFIIMAEVPEGGGSDQAPTDGVMSGAVSPFVWGAVIILAIGAGIFFATRRRSDSTGDEG